MRFKFKKTLSLILIAAFLITTFTGCSSKAEKQAKYKSIGMDAMNNGDYSAAVDDFNEALSYAPNNVTEEEIDICYYKAAAQYLTSDFSGAIDTYTALITYDESNSEAYFLRGCLYINEGESDKALKDYKEAVALDEENYDLYIEIYNNLLALNYSSESMEFLNLALEVEGNSAANYVGRGRIYILLGQYDAAIKALTKASDKKSNIAKLYLSEVYTLKGDDTQATELLEEYINSEATSESLNALGNLHMKNGEYEEALEAYEQGLSLDKITNEKELRKNEVGALEYTGDFDTAYEKAVSYVADYPNDQDMQRELIFLTTRHDGPYTEDTTSEDTTSDDTTSEDDE